MVLGSPRLTVTRRLHRPLHFRHHPEPEPAHRIRWRRPALLPGRRACAHDVKSLLTEVYTRIPDIDAPEPDFLVANFINGIKRLPATWNSLTERNPA